MSDPRPRRRSIPFANQLWQVNQRDHHESGQMFRRRQIRSVVVLIIGAVGLGLSLRMDPLSAWFPMAALGVSAVWILGALWTGRLFVGQLVMREKVVRPIVQPIVLGLLLATMFILGAYLVSMIPVLADQVRQVLGFRKSSSIVVLTITTVISGFGEELFFRGGLYAAIPTPHQVWVSTLLYVCATAMTGNLMLAFAAVVLGVVVGLQRRATGGVLAPILTHITWSMAMLHVLPLIISG